MINLNLPELEGSSFLIAGAGGGFDIFGGIPIATELLRQGKDVVLASYSLKSKGFAVRESTEEDYPEGQLKIDVPVYTFGKNGVKLLRSGYQELIEKYNIIVK